MRVIACLLPLVTCLALAAGEGEPAPLDVRSGTWHMGFQNIFGVGMRRGKQEGRNIDLYPVFENGRMVNGLATARSFNTSVHIPENMDVTVDAGKLTVTGTMDMLVTPDGWVPKDRKSFVIKLTVDGSFVPGKDGAILLTGTYTARRADGEPLYDDVKEVKEALGGGVGRTEGGWDNAVWTAGMTLESEPGALDEDTLHLSLGIADGKVTWGALGLSAQAKWSAYDSFPIDVSGFGPVVAGKVTGTVELTGRHLHPGGDPAAKYVLTIDARRVQGMPGMKGTLAPAGRPEDARKLAGRGSARKGGGDARNWDAAIWRHRLDTRPWFKPVEGFVAPEPNEHPRLVFRQSDVARLRERAQTPEGKAIIARLRELLGQDGEAVPTEFNETPPHNHNKTDGKSLKPGMFTTWHAAGFGFLYQLTGEQKYADMARQCVEFMLAGKNDIDNRYGWAMPGTEIRCGSVLGAMAYAYDLCHDGWPEDFRRKIALEMQNFNKVTASSQEGYDQAKAEGKEVGDAPQKTSVTTLAGRTKYPPGSNHYGSHMGGTLLAMLAIRGDEGVDTAFCDARIADIEGNIPRLMEYGFGDGGYYAEGFPPSRLSTEGGFLELVIALRCAAGRDYVDVERPHVNALTTRWIYHLGGPGKLHYPGRGTYGHPDDTLSQTGVRGSFAFGFGAVSEKYQRPLLWVWNTFGRGDPDIWAAGTYAHAAIHAFVHWPVGQEAQDPDEVMPKVLVDTKHGYVCARNRWQDENDIIVTYLVENGPQGYYSSGDGPAHGRNGRMRVWGLGKKEVVDIGATGTVTHFRRAKDGSFVMTAGEALAVDLSGAAGAELVVVSVTPPPKADKKKRKKNRPQAPDPAKRFFPLDVDGRKLQVQVYCLCSGEPPEAKVEGTTITVGGQVFSYEDGNLSPATFAE